MVDGRSHVPVHCHQLKPVVMDCTREDPLTPLHAFVSFQVGEYFGYSTAFADVDGNG